MKRFDILNTLIKKCGFTSYLEIGVQRGQSYKLIECENKQGVDPRPRWNDGTINEMTSDDFFKSNTEKFDIIFIDGLHHADQVQKDIDNSLKSLNKDGFVILHDCNPIEKQNQEIPMGTQRFWNGDVWKALVLAQQKYPYDIFTIDTDHGCAIINTRKEIELDYDNYPLTFEELHYEGLEKHRVEWLNLKDVQYFKEFIGELCE